MIGVDPCPLCCARSAHAELHVPYERIWDELARQFGVTFSQGVIERHSPQPVATLYRCRDCGLGYFSPLVSASGKFYEEFSTSVGYYEDVRWEFDEIASTIAPGALVLDVGCGSGNFLERVVAAGGVAHGFDANLDALAKLERRGFSAHSDLEALAVEREGTFDVVTAFHLIEHLDDVAEVIEPAIRCLRPGGRLLLSVPNRDRFRTSDFEPLDHPPHHVSRWSDEQLRFLASKFGLDGVRCWYEPLRWRTVLRLLGWRVRDVVQRRELSPLPPARQLRRGMAVIAEMRVPTEPAP